MLCFALFQLLHSLIISYIVCESDGNGGYDISLKRCPDVEVFDMDDPEGCIMPTQEDLDRLCNFAY